MITFTPDELLKQLQPILSIDDCAFLYPDAGVLWCVFNAPWGHINRVVMDNDLDICVDVMVVPKTNWADSSFYKPYEYLTADDCKTMMNAASTTCRYIVYAD